MADWEKLQIRYIPHLVFGSVPQVLEYLSKQKPGKEIQREDNNDLDLNIFWNWRCFFLYFSFFGFWDVIRDEDSSAYSSKRRFRAKSITPSDFGVTIAPILYEARNLHNWNLPARRKDGEWNAIPGSPLPDSSMYRYLDEKFKSKKAKTIVKVDKGKPGEPFFLPFVPLFMGGELQQTLPREGIKFVDGTYVFKIALAEDLWRRIEISAGNTLLHLHDAIQTAYDFDDDHLYSFFMDGNAWSDERFSSPYEDDGPFVDEVRIGELGLYVGRSILYLFDYGDEWRFQVELEDIHKEGPKPRRPKIVDEKGEAPQQYYYGDDDEEEEEDIFSILM